MSSQSDPNSPEGKVPSSKVKDPPLFQKLCLKYYMIIPIYLILGLILEKTNNISFANVFVSTYAVLGYYFFKDNPKTQPNDYAEYHNRSPFPAMVLLVHCLATDLFLAFIWIRYDDLITGPAAVIQIYLMLTYSTTLNIDACHELIHRHQLICRVVGYLNMAVFQFTLYPIQHLYVHHKKVGSPEDPVSPPKNINIYRYYLRVIYSSYKINYDYSKLFMLLMIVLNWCYVGILCLAAYKQGLSFEQGLPKIIFFLVYSYLAIFALEMIEYVEHYGLIYRQSVAKNKIIQDNCSWNTEHNLIFNLITFRFQRHTDHHMNAYKAFPAMELTKRMPTYPFDFGTGMLLSLFPSVWYKLANPLVDQVLENRPLEKGHIQYVKRTMNVVRLGFVVLVLGLAINSVL